MSAEKEIENIIKLWYKGIEKDVEKWYNTPHSLIGVDNMDFSIKTPKKRIEDGEAEKVLAYLKKVVG